MRQSHGVHSLRVQGAQRGTVQARRYGVQHSHQARSVPRDDTPAHQGRDVLGRLQAAIVGQHHQVLRRDARIGAEQERDVDVLNLHVTATNTPAIALYERLVLCQA